MRDGLTLASLRWHNHKFEETRTASTVRRFTVNGDPKNAFLVSGTEVLFLPNTFSDLDDVTVYNGWFPALSRPVSVISAVAALSDRNKLGHRLVDFTTRVVVGPKGGPDAIERARTRTYVTAIASSRTTRLAEVHLEGPSIYNVTSELIASAADHLTTTPPDTPGVVGPIEALGINTFRDMRHLRAQHPRDQ